MLVEGHQSEGDHMSRTGGHPVRSRGLAIGAWIAVAAVPLAWTLGIFLAFLSGEGDPNGAGTAALGLLGIAVFAATPAVAVVLAVRLRRTGHRSGRAAAIVSGSLLALTLLVTVLVGPLAIIAVAVVIAPVGVYLWRFGSLHPPA
jgi:hypothetical protein